MRIDGSQKKLMFFCLIIGFFAATLAQAKPLSSKQQKNLVNQESLRDQMSKMIISLADLDILVNRDKVQDYEIFQEDAERILAAIKKIRELDKDKVFEPFLKDLEKPTENLLKYSVQKSEKALRYPEEIFNACFRCHQAKRGY
ncbi:MAG: hypothetical protein H7A33_03450 [Deltaproteobacteria bacterium]|nr:hypothetical protein [Deltaproteobacteria bacterium]